MNVDVNDDGKVDILDLILVGRHFGQPIPEDPRADINSDGVVDIVDLVMVGAHFGEVIRPAVTAAPQLPGNQHIELLMRWLAQAKAADDGSLMFRYGIAALERLLNSVAPQRTRLLANYPNPFNPDTWIPYDLGESAAVSISIYDTHGTLVRILAIGRQSTGRYHSKSRAAYWDGRNAVGERVASGVYYYTLHAGQFTKTRRMMVVK